MPILKFPLSDKARVLLLKNILRRVEAEARDGREYLPADIVTQISTHQATFAPLVTDLVQYKGDKKRATHKKNEAVHLLTQYVRAFRAGVLNRVKMMLQTEVYPAYFDIDKSLLTMPAEKWLSLADKYLHGERAAVADGHPPMCNPSASQLQEKLEVAQHAVEAAEAAGSTLDHHQNNMVDIRKETDQLIRVVNAHLNISLRGFESDDIRSIKRSYGFRYDTDDSSNDHEESE